MELITAAKNGDFNSAFNLLQCGHHANVRDHDNATPLYWSACHGHSSLCEVLIEGGSDVNARVKWGSTPLHAASDRNHVDCVKILLENGADVRCQNNRGDTPLHIAAYRGNSAITRQLLCARSDTTLQNDKGKTPQQEAIEGGHQDIAECIERFVNAGTKNTSQQQNGGIHQTTPPVHHIRNGTANAPPLPGERTNGTPQFHPAIYGSLSSGTTTSLTESMYSDSTSGTESYDYSDSSVFNSVPENSQIMKGFHCNLKRSISVGGHDTLRPPHHVTRQTNQINPVTKTNSECNIPFTRYQNNMYQNDINKGHSSMDSLCAVTERMGVVSEPEMVCVMRTSHTPEFSTKLTSNGRCVATESVDDSEFRLAEDDRLICQQLPDMRSQTAALNRPLRASTGSVRDNFNDNHEGFIKTLQTQLVNAYKEIEKLTTEREDLKFKCSTVLSRLADTEQLLDEKTKECEMVKELVESSRTADVHTRGTTCSVPVAARHVGGEADEPGFGIVKLSEKLHSELPDLPHLQGVLQDNLNDLYQKLPVADIPEVANKELVPGVDYVIIGENQATWLQQKSTDRIPLAVAFSVKHLKSGQRMVLKMLLILETPQTTCWTFEPVSLKHGRDCMWLHPNVGKPVHQFEGSTERFKRFVNAPPGKYVQLCSRTLFIVTNETKTFRTLLETINRNGDSQVSTVAEYGSFMEFIVQITYQVLSLISYLEDNGVIHGHITEDTIVMDKTLRPLLSEIEATVCMSSPRIPSGIQSDQVAIPGDCQKIQTIRKAECSGDLRSVCELFHRILTSPSTGMYLRACDMVLKQRLTAVQQVLQAVISPTTTERCTSKMVLQRIGCIMFGPERKTVHSQKDCSEFLLSQTLKMTSDVKDNRPPGECTDFMPVQESVALRRPEVKARFLASIGAEELWDVYRCCDRENWLVS